MTVESWFESLRGYGLSLPEASEDHPWGHSALKVRGKTFCWLDQGDAGLSVTTKLPVSRDFATVFDFTEPTGYGLGRSGWITSRFARDGEPDLYLLRRWIAESYRAVAPKKLAANVPDRTEGLSRGRAASAPPPPPGRAGSGRAARSAPRVRWRRR